MADFNLGSRVSMDVDPLKAAARTVERNLKEINKRLKEQRKEFEKNDVSAESLAERENNLGRAIKLQQGLLVQRQKKLQDLNKEVKDSNNITDEQKIKLQQLSGSVKKAQRQLDDYENELKDVQVQQKTFGNTTKDVKRNLNDLRNEVKMSQADFEKSAKASSDYEDHIDGLTGALGKSERQLKQLDDNLKIVSKLKGENSRETKNLKSEINKERLSYSQLEVTLKKVKNEYKSFKNENSELSQSVRKTEQFIDNMKNNVNALSNELRQINANFKGSSHEVDDYKMHLQQLTAIQSKQKNVIQELENEYQKVSAIQGYSSSQSKELKSEIDKQRTAFSVLNAQINQTTKEYDEYRLENSKTNITLGEAKRRLEAYNNELQMNSVTFKNTERTVQSYKNQLAHVNATITQHQTYLNALKNRHKEVAIAQGANSKEAGKLQAELYKESLAMQITQGRADALGDELDELKRKQRGVYLTGSLMVAGMIGARDSMDRIATTLRSIGELGQGIISGILITQFSSLVPILGSIVSLGAGLGGILVSASGGAVALGGAFTIAGSAVKLFSSQATYALKMLEDGTLNITAEVREYENALNGLKGTWQGLIAQNQAQIFNTMANGINSAEFALGALNPFLTTTANQIEVTSSKMLNWVINSNNVRQALNILNNQGPGIFQNLLNATMNFADGSVAMFNKLSPLYSWASQGFENMSLSFQRWSNSVEGSQAINGFIEYTKSNLPIVGRIFGNVFGGLFNLFSAFSGHSHNVLLGIEGVTNGFRQWSSELKNSNGFKEFVQYLETNGPKVWQLIKNITGVLWGLAKGMAPVGAQVLDLTVKFTGWLSQMMNTHPWLGKIIGGATACAGAIMLMYKPIALVYGSLSGMRKALLLATGAQTLFGKSGAFAALGMKRLAIQAKLSAGAMTLWTGVTKGAALANKALALSFKGIGVAIRSIPVIGWIIAGITALVAAITYLWKTNSGFRNAVISSWNAIKNTAMTVFGFLKPYILNIWNAIKNGTTLVWNLLRVGAKVAWNAIKFAVMNPVQAVKIGVSTIWNGLKLVTFTVFNAIKNFMLNTWRVIKNTVVSLVKGIWSGIKSAFNASWLFIRTIFTSIKNFIVNIWNAIKNRTLSIVRVMINGVKSIFNGFSSTTRNIFNGLRSFFLSVWNAIKNGVVKAARATWNVVRSIWNSFYNGTRSLFNKLKSWLLSIWNAIRSNVTRIASNLWSRVKTTWTNLWNGTRNIFIRLKNFLTDKWNAIKNSVTGIASSLWGAVKRTFNNMKNGLANIIDKIKGHIGGMVRAIKKGLNSLIDGLNWVGSKLSLPKIPKLSTGTQKINRHITTTSDGRLKQGTMAVVGDRGPGNGRGKDGRRELIQYPNGRTALTPAKDTTTFLPRGSRVISGSMRQRYEEAEGAGMKPRFNIGTLPRFSVGTWFGNAKNWVGDKLKGAGAAMRNSAKWLSEKIGDVMDYMDNPGKLFNKVTSMMGIDFSALTKGMGIVGDITRAAWKRIKKGAIEWIKGGFDAQAGDGSVFDGFKILQRYSAPPYPPNPNYPFNGGVHHGIDYDTPVGTPIRTPMGGRVRSWYDNYGGGKAITVQKGRTFLWFMHLSEQLRRTGEQIKAGQLIGKSGNTGSMTNYRHLHFQVNQGGEANRFSVEPEQWLRKNDKTGGGKNAPGGSGAANARRAIRAAQNILGGQYKAGWITDEMMRVARRESNYTANAVNNWDSNARAGTPSRGMFQMIDPSFRAYAKAGYGNPLNPTHQAISAMRYIVGKWVPIMGSWRAAFRRAGDSAYAKGTNRASKGLATVFEEGGEIMNLRGGEQIIPNDVSIAAIKSVINSDIFGRTQSAVYEAISRFADEIRVEKEVESTKAKYIVQKQQEEINVLREQTEVLKTLVNQFSELLVDTGVIKNKPTGITRDEYDREHNRAQDKRERLERQSNMYRGGALA